MILTPRSNWIALPLLVSALAGCVMAPHAAAPVRDEPAALAYRCEDGQRFTAQLDDEAARLDGLAGGPDALLRDAGGLTPAQRVYAGPRLRAEFGLGPNGRGAVLQVLQPAPSVLQCSAG